MRRTRIFYFLLLTALTVSDCLSLKAQVINFNSDWKFHLGHAADATKDFNYSIAKVFDKTGKAKNTCIAPEFADSNWQSIRLPHDWAVALPFVNSANRDVEAHGFKPIGGLFPQNSIGWYRKSFDIPVADSGKRISIRFDGIYRDSKIWVNGFYAGANLSGYTGNEYDITDFVKFGAKNVVVVRADASQYEGWFYEGAGIYRDCWLIKKHPIHIPSNGIFVHTTVKGKTASVTIETTVSNKDIYPGGATVFTDIYNRDGKKIAQSTGTPLRLKAGETNVVTQQVNIISPKLWDIGQPYLYRAISYIQSKGKIIDQLTTRFGVRIITIDAEKGLFLNGQRIKIKGVCCHQDHAGVGAAIPSHLQYYRIGLLKEMGANAYRTSHNPPSPDVLDACDSLGMLVLDETRLLNSSAEYLNQFKELILRDRNHPSVFMWSIGNEEEMAQNNSHGKRIAQSMMLLQKELDPTRTSTYGANNGKIATGVNEVIPVRGVNYFLNELDAYHQQRPSQSVIGTEVGSTVTTRGVYAKDTTLAYLPDHDITFPHWATTAEKWWSWADARPWFMGGFVWTGFDYRGEPTPFRWPNINSHFGIMDICGFPKNNYFYYQAWWSKQDVLQVSPHWNHSGKEGQPIDVWVNSNAEQVELFLNGRSLGKKDMPINGHLQWQVLYQPGILKAIGYKNGRQWETVVQTSGKAATILMMADRLVIPAGEAAIINVTVTDSLGRLVADANEAIFFTITGDARILGVGNGDPSSHEPDQMPNGQYKRRLFNGRCQLIIEAGESGQIVIAATAAGLSGALLKTTIQP